MFIIFSVLVDNPGKGGDIW